MPNQVYPPNLSSAFDLPECFCSFVLLLPTNPAAAHHTTTTIITNSTLVVVRCAYRWLVLDEAKLARALGTRPSSYSWLICPNLRIPPRSKSNRRRRRRRRKEQPPDQGEDDAEDNGASQRTESPAPAASS